MKVAFWDTNIFKIHVKPIPPIPEKVWRNPLYFIAFGFGSGAMPFAPGTFGTLLAIPFYLLFEPLPVVDYLGFLMIFLVLSIAICEFVSRKIHVHDHPGMCLDEFVGFFVTMINAPKGWMWILIGFILFRFFDIVKPFPIRTIDKKVPGGVGMVGDDIVAGIYSFILIQILAWGLGYPGFFGVAK